MSLTLDILFLEKHSITTTTIYNDFKLQHVIVKLPNLTAFALILFVILHIFFRGTFYICRKKQHHKQSYFPQFNYILIQYFFLQPDEELNYLAPMIGKRAQLNDPSNDTAFLNMIESENYVLVRDRPAVDLLMYNDYRARSDVDESRRCTFVVTPTKFMTKGRAFAYPMNSRLRELFDPL